MRISGLCLGLFVQVLVLVQSGRGKVSPLALTDLINQNKTNEAKNASRVNGLPNAPNIESYSGYFRVNPEYNSNLFFWFFPSNKTPETAPLVVWLEGGPGASSMWSLFTLSGPLRVDKDMKVTLNNYSWTQEYSVLFIDNPVGTGFSYTDKEQGFSTDQNSVANNLYEFFVQFFKCFGEYKARDLYITGESYAGKYVPAIGYKLMQMSNESGINLKGVAIGNGLTDPINQMKSTAFMRSTGLIDEKGEKDIQSLEDQVRESYKAKDYLKASQQFMDLNLRNSLASNLTGYHNFYNFLLSNDSATEPEDDSFVKYLNLPETQRAIHVSNITYAMSNETVFDKLKADIIKSVEPNLTALIPNYKVMLFDGNLDMLVGVAQVNGMLENSGWKYRDQYYNAKRVIWKVTKNDTEVAGYAKTFDDGNGKFTMLVIRNSGHSIAKDQPRSCLDMIKRFVNNIPFDQ